MPNVQEKLILWFKEVGKTEIELVGEKSANLGEMTQAGFPVPPGFIITSKAYYKFIQENNFQEKAERVLEKIDFNKQFSLIKASKKIKQLIVQGKISEPLTRDIFLSYKKLGGVFKDALVAVRPSVIAGNLPNSLSFGKKEAFLNIKGEANLLIKIKEIWSSLFDASAIFYRHEQNLDHFKVAIAVPVQKMIESEQSGVMLTIDPNTNDKSKVIIKAILGLGEHITQIGVNPDHYEVSKSKLKIIGKQISLQTKKLIKKGIENKEVKLSSKEGSQQKISERIILHLAEIGMKLEKHYYFPQEINYAIEKNKIYIIQTRPITNVNDSIRQAQDKQVPRIEDKEEGQKANFQLLLKGDPASPGIATGPVKILKTAKEINKVVSGDILVIPQINHDFIVAIKKAAAIVVEKGDKTSFLIGELVIPAVVGTLQATTVLKEGEVVTVNGGKGEIYKGTTFVAKKDEIDNSENLKTATKVYVNLAESKFAEKVSQKNVDGVGLLRAEFIMSEIGIHPKKMILDGKRKIYIEKLAENMALFAKNFSPRPVVYRTSDFRTDEYRNLKGGNDFEPVEQNPILGFRGAFRYIKDPDVFSLELEAIKLVRNKYHLKNLWLLIPFVRTVEELVLVKQLIASIGLYRSPSFKIWMMVEIPSNVILLDKFIATGIDGISIGSNDLTMLLLGTDCNNGSVATEFDEQNDAVIWALEKVIKTCHKYGITSSLCGQAASSYPKLLEKLVQFGITSVSVSPDAIESTREIISKFEKKLLWQK